MLLVSGCQIWNHRAGLRVGYRRAPLSNHNGVAIVDGLAWRLNVAGFIEMDCLVLIVDYKLTTNALLAVVINVHTTSLVCRDVALGLWCLPTLTTPARDVSRPISIIVFIVVFGAFDQPLSCFKLFKISDTWYYMTASWWVLHSGNCFDVILLLGQSACFHLSIFRINQIPLHPLIPYAQSLL